jgi:hypothetical protein
MCAMSRDEYLRMGKEHTMKDEKIERKAIIEKEKQLNGHLCFR